MLGFGPMWSRMRGALAIKNFTVQGINPATGGIAVLTLMARSETDAKQQAEGAGLMYVVVREAPPIPRDEGEAEGKRGTGSSENPSALDER
jgi:hypothetical protein